MTLAQPTLGTAATNPNPRTSRVVSLDGRTLPLHEVHLRVDAGGGLARTVLEQRFANPFAEPLMVSYQVPLPADGAVSGFAFTIGERRIVGEIEGREAARQRFEDAILEGRTAGLLDQERTALFTQQLGNVPAGAEIRAELTIDHPLAFVDESGGSWEWRFPTVVAPRYAGGDGRIDDADRVAVDVAESPLRSAVQIALAIRDDVRGDPQSSSHPVEHSRSGERVVVALSDPAHARLDRDIVVRWPVAEPEVGVRLAQARLPDGHPRADLAYGLITIVPPHVDRPRASLPRDLIVLLDTSGSMSGPPLDQAKAVVAALIESLSDRDQLELIAFSSQPERYRRRPVYANASERAAALRWLDALEAGGGTEMLDGVRAALAPLRAGAQRQVVLVTDGLIGFEREVIREVAWSLPRGSRVHTVGVGSAINRSLTRAVGRAGNGVELNVGLEESAESAARRLLARTELPIVVDLEVGGSAAAGRQPARLPDVFARSPAIISVALLATGGELVLRGRTPEGAWEQRLAVSAIEPGSGDTAICALWARERVEDLEARSVFDDARDTEIEGLGRDFQISTRLTSWIAVSEEPGVDPTQPIRRVTMPHELPYRMSVEGLGLRPAPFFASAHLLGVSRMEVLGLVRGVRARLDRPDLLKKPSPSLIARVRRRKSNQLLMELDVLEDIAWDPDDWDWLRLEDDERVRCRPIAKDSTAAGTFEPGVTLRLVVEFDEPLLSTPVGLLSSVNLEIPLR